MEEVLGVLLVGTVGAWAYREITDRTRKRKSKNRARTRAQSE